MLLNSMLVSAETCFLYFSELSLTPLRHALTSFYVCSTCVIRYFLFYKCCYLFQTQTEYLFFRYLVSSIIFMTTSKKQMLELILS